MANDTAIRADEHGLRHLTADGDPFYGFEWTEIFSISGSKLDLMESECIILSFDNESGEFIELTDRMPGFADAVAAISQHLLGVDADWFSRIAGLSITADPLVIWERR